MDDPIIPASERLEVEIELLKAMYPEMEWNSKTRELKFEHEDGGVLVLRVPDSYPGTELLDLVSVTDTLKHDIRSEMRGAILNLQLPEGEEVIDTIIQAYCDLMQSRKAEASISNETQPLSETDSADLCNSKTVIVWLHHLLATSKRKLALNPTTRSPVVESNLSGMTKPGYPGIMIFTGHPALVDAHVAELKSQRWQAFQVRFEECEKQSQWKYEHGQGICEKESMAEVVQSIIGEEQQQAFLRAVGVK